MAENRPNRQVSADRAERPTRNPIGSKNRISLPKGDPNYVYRIVKDIDDRVNRFIEAGYEHVNVGTQIGDTRVAEGTPLGSKMTKDLGRGERGYVMRIKKEWYEEDQKAKVTRSNELQDSMRPQTAEDKRRGLGLTDT